MTDINEDLDIIKISETRIKYINVNFKKLSYKMYDYTCDVKITVGEETFKAHKAVLEAASDYFAAMFTHPMQEQNSNIIDIKGMSDEGMSAMMEYLYHGYITLDADNAEGITEAARFLHITWVLDRACHHYLIHHLSMCNYNLTLQLIDEYFLNGVEMNEQIFDYFGECFEELIGKKEFFQLAIEAIIPLLSSTPINANEYDIYRFVVTWLCEDENRLGYTNRLLQLIRFPLISLQQLDDIMDDLNDGKLDHLLPHMPPLENATLPHLSSVDNASVAPSLLHQLILSAIEHQRIPYMQCLHQRKDGVSRGSMPMLMLYSGLDDDTYVNYAVTGGCGFLTEALDTTFLSSVFEFASAAVLGNHLFIAGGYNRANWCSSHAFYSYAPHTQTWAQLTDMQKARVSFSLCADINKSLLYAIGGIDHVVLDGVDREVMHDSVEIYDPRDNLWHLAQSLPKPTFNAVATVFNDKIFLTGGISEDPVESVPMCRVVCLVGDAWESQAGMHIGRHAHSATPLDDHHLLVLGGSQAKTDDTAGFDPAMSMEIYDLLTDQWTLFGIRGSLGHIYHSCTIGDDLWVVTGESRDSMNLHQLKKRQLLSHITPQQSCSEKDGSQERQVKNVMDISCKNTLNTNKIVGGLEDSSEPSGGTIMEDGIFDLGNGEPCSGFVHKMVCLEVALTARLLRELHKPIAQTSPHTYYQC